MKLRSNLIKTDKLLLITSLLLFLFGLVMIFSSSTVAAVLVYKNPSYFFVVRQGAVELVMLLVSLFIICTPTKTYSKLSFLLPIAMIGLLLLVKLFGTEANGAKSWLDLGVFNFQSSEFVKTLLILYMATIYGDKKKWNNEGDLLKPLIIPVICAFLIAKEPDLGTAIITAGITFLIFIELPIKKGKVMKIIYGLIAIGALAVFMLYSTNSLNKILTPAQEARFDFRKPCSRYLEKTGYQVCNSYIAINNGGLYGLGLGNSKQKNLYLPESYTDFIFPIIVEEFGLIGTGILFFAYMLLLFSILTIARHATNLRNSIIAFGTFAYILIHLVINLAGVTGLFLMTGVPLPFMSYGGSFIINLFILLSLTQRVAIETKEARVKKKA
jgi:cell division protein FtsW